MISRPIGVQLPDLYNRARAGGNRVQSIIGPEPTTPHDGYADRSVIDSQTMQDWCDRIAAPYRHDASGVIVAIVGPGLDLYRPYGRLDRRRDNPPDASTVFEIGSITKVFTAVLAAKLAEDGRIDLDAPIGTIAAEFAGAPEWITPRSLSTHTAGLPRLTVPLWRAIWMNDENPYASIGRNDLVRWMAAYRPTRAPAKGRSPRYSNLGVGLLGEVLAIAAGDRFGTLLERDVLTPLGLSDTRLSLTESMRTRLATPHASRGRETPPWDFDAIAGAGALKSTVRDLVTFGQAAIEGVNGRGPLARAIARTLEVQVPGSHPRTPDQCLGWIRLPAFTRPERAYFHDGGTRGSSSALVVVPEAGVVMAVLANAGITLWRTIKIARSRPEQILAEVLSAVADPQTNPR